MKIKGCCYTISGYFRLILGYRDETDETRYSSPTLSEICLQDCAVLCVFSRYIFQFEQALVRFHRMMHILSRQRS